MNKQLLIPVLLILSLSVSSQTNYLGYSGNMVSGDFDHDGFIDDIAAFNTASEIPTFTMWIANQGWIEEKEAHCFLPFDFLSTKSLQNKIVSGDFDNDGYIDDIASIYEIGLNKTSITVWTNNNDKLTPKQWWYGPDFDANQTSQTLVSGDFDNDGFVDDIAAFYDYEQLRTKIFVWKSDGKKFAWPGTWWIGNDFNATKVQGTLVAGDFDHDGYKDDIAALYNYIDGYCKAFVWNSTKNKFNWPYTWFKQANFYVDNIKGNVVAGDFNQNGFEDNIAAMYKDDENNSSVLVFERGKKGFNSPEIWWYGNNEATLLNNRLIAIDVNENKINDQFTGLSVEKTEATLRTWTAANRQFETPTNNWQGLALSANQNSAQNSAADASNVQLNAFDIYPNPSHGTFTITVPKSNEPNVQIAIYNMLGNLIFTQQATSGQQLLLNFDDWNKGTYMIQISGNETNLKKSLIIE